MNMLKMWIPVQPPSKRIIHLQHKRQHHELSEGSCELLPTYALLHGVVHAASKLQAALCSVKQPLCNQLQVHSGQSSTANIHMCLRHSVCLLIILIGVMFQC